MAKINVPLQRSNYSKFSALRHEDDVGAAAVLALAFGLLRDLAELEAGDLARLAEDEFGRQEGRGREGHDEFRVRVLLHVAAELVNLDLAVDSKRIALEGNE